MDRLGACPTCSSAVPSGNRFCGTCGQPVSPSSALPTVNVPSGAAAPRARSDPAGARFLPGAMLAGRYRIVGLLGKGGMGEVYRADDLKLGQAVALKFLPPGFDADPERLARFLQEVRTARQVSHANVCRVYDAGEAAGQHFLSMEYVDGEDLASLLRRIGHVPKDKAIQIARELCAGLAAAHETGVLHRDLKPANVMIDGRGRARITDFGLAAFAGAIGAREISSGTPAYMAPEQLAGREVSVRSDLYSLGLVLYELFTGKPAFNADSLGELRRLQTESTPATPSSLIEGFDPRVERAIVRCLDPDPARRPPSALAVAAALPGGDPLAAALAAGETPSPEMVAAAGDREVVPAAISWGAFAVFVAALVGIFAIAPRTSLLAMVRLDKPPQFLQERAREILAQVGHDAKPADSVFTFEVNRSYLEDVVRRDGTAADRWGVLASGVPAIVFWYRQSPAVLTPINAATLNDWMRDPPSTSPGMAKVGLDPDGHLVSFLVVAGEKTEPAATASEPDWEPLLRATGVDAKTLQPVQPEWAPPTYADRRAAWTGSWAKLPDVRFRIEAAAAGARPVSLRVVAPWTRPAEEAKPPAGIGSRASALTLAVVFPVVVVVAAIVAFRNVRRGRGDRRGALRLALYLGAARMLWFLGAHHVAAPAESDVFASHFSYSMMRVGLAYVFYLAIEPYARRLWPRMLVSWVRVLDGRFRDPLVGRDLLIGSAAGAVYALAQLLTNWIPERMGGAVALPVWSEWGLGALRGTLPAFVSVVGIHTQELMDIIFPMTLLLLFRILLRRNDLALLLVSLVGFLVFYPASGSIPGSLAGYALFVTIYWLVLFRAGLLGVAAMTSVGSILFQMPMTPHPEGWYLSAVLFALGAVGALALYGLRTSQAGRALFRDDILAA